MRKVILVCSIFLMSIIGHSQARFPKGIKIPNSIEKPNFGNKHELIPLMRNNRRKWINSYIHKDTLIKRISDEIILDKNGFIPYKGAYKNVYLGEKSLNFDSKLFLSDNNYMIDKTIITANYLNLSADDRETRLSSLGLSFNHIGKFAINVIPPIINDNDFIDINLTLPGESGFIALKKDIKSYTAGSNINIDSNNVISSTGGASGGLPVGFYDEGNMPVTIDGFEVLGGNNIHYVRVGNLVTINFYANGINTVKPGSELKINLPEIPVKSKAIGKLTISATDLGSSYLEINPTLNNNKFNNSELHVDKFIKNNNLGFHIYTGKIVYNLQEKVYPYNVRPLGKQKFINGQGGGCFSYITDIYKP